VRTFNPKKHYYLSKLIETRWQALTDLNRLFSNTETTGNGDKDASEFGGYSYSIDLMVEILCTYRLLFGQHQESTNEFRSIRPKGFQDPLLKKLCGSSCKDAESRVFYSGLEVADCKPMYSASADFPLTGQRLLILQDYMNNQNPSDFRTLWHDKRDVLRWYTFWAVVVVGGLSIISSFASMALTAVQVYQGGQNSKP
jgi:hypothetical protein